MLCGSGLTYCVLCGSGPTECVLCGSGPTDCVLCGSGPTDCVLCGVALQHAWVRAARHSHAICLLLCAMQSSAPKKKKGMKDHIPYRDSVLTWILKENLGQHSGSSFVL